MTGSAGFYTDSLGLEKWKALGRRCWGSAGLGVVPPAGSRDRDPGQRVWWVQPPKTLEAVFLHK